MSHIMWARGNKKNTIYLIIISILIVSIVLLYVLTKISGGKTLDHDELVKVTQISNCATGLQELGNKEVDFKSDKDAITYLNYKGYCLADVGKYNEAKVVLNRLATRYEKLNDKESAAGTRTDIAAFEKRQARQESINQIPKNQRPDGKYENLRW